MELEPRGEPNRMAIFGSTKTIKVLEGRKHGAQF